MARGHDVTVFTAGSSPGRFSEQGVAIRRLKQRFTDPTRHERDFALRIALALRRGRFDVIHSLGMYDALTAIWTRRLGARHRTVYTNLGIPLREGPGAQPQRLHERVVAGIDVYGCLSRYCADVLEAEWGRRGALTPGGVDMEWFVPAKRTDAPTVLFSGVVDVPRKGLSVLLDAFPTVLAAEPTSALWISGPGDAAPLVAAARPEVAARTTVLPLGEPEAQRERYAAAWVTAIPSDHEAFGLVAIESLACGTPIVAGDDAALTALVEPGRTGLLVPPRDAAALADALVTAVALARVDGTVTACRESVRGYDWVTALGPHYEALYTGDLAGPRSRRR